MYKQVSVKLTMKQYKYCKEAGLSVSEFVRRSIDYYINYTKSNNDIIFVEDLISFLNNYKSNSKVLLCNSNELLNNTDVILSNSRVTPQDTKGVQSNSIELHNNTNEIQNKFNFSETDLKTITRLLNNGDNLNSIPDYTLKKLSKEYALSKSAIQAWIAENKEALKQA